MKHAAAGAMLALVNGRIVLPTGIETGRALLLAQGKIVDRVDETQIPADCQRLDVEGRLISPGLIDLHIHGALGHSFNTPSATAWSAIAQASAAHGVTTLLATLSTDALDHLEACLSFGRSWLAAQPDAGAQIAGIHLEGPFFAPAFAGAQNPAHLRPIEPNSVDRLLAYRDILRIVSLAPELPGALELIERLAAIGIVPAAGHSGAADTDFDRAVGRGLRHAIHLWSGQSTTHRVGPWRVPGLLEAVLTSDQVTAELICDNRHLPVTLMKLALRCLGPDRICAISDATNGAGLPEGAHFTFAGLDCVIDSGVAMLPDRTSFAGSTTFLNQMLPVLIEAVGLPVHDAIRMASLTPARVIGIDQHKGSLAAGKDADIVVFNRDFSVWRTLIGGRWRYAKADSLDAKSETF
ncbi:MAG: N-acetylglucosamine-6-phosphate deacetylase [Candidatus Flexifilum sp.]|jgi:N-acetylglucosamine-6-phosphate deacetylase